MGNRTRAFKALALSAAGAFTLASGVLLDQGTKDDAPAWIEEPTAFFASPPGDARLVVGRAQLRDDLPFSEALRVARSNAGATLGEPCCLERLWLWESPERELHVLYVERPENMEFPLPPKKLGPPPEPSWVKNPASYFDEPRNDLWIAVGRADAQRSASWAFRRASADARMELARMIETKVNRTEGRQSTEVVLSQSKVVESWEAPDGSVYVLMTAPKDV